MSQGRNVYGSTGVDYAALDAGKRMALEQALATSGLLTSHGGEALDASRGEPAFVFRLAGRTFALVVEGLGTKSMIAREWLETTGEDRFADIAVDSVGAVVNDLCCVGAAPLVVNAYFATGNASWYEDHDRYASLLSGWRAACEESGCAWGGGESPSLPGLVAETEIEIAGSAIGALPEGADPILGEELDPGDEIVLVASSGLHANGASLVRLIAREDPAGLGAELPSGRTLGDAVLDPSILYARLVARLLEERVPVTYLSHITGHGLLKIMRPARSLTYRLSDLPPVPEVLSFVTERTGMDGHSAYSTLNMGSGYAVYCKDGSGERVVEICTALGLEARVGGAVEEGPRQVILEPLDIVFESDEMVLSPTGDGATLGAGPDSSAG